MEAYINNNAGHVVAIPGTGDPIPGTGQTLTNASADTDTTATVVAEGLYAITAITATDGIYLGIADVTTPANIIWACPGEAETIIYIPSGITTLHYAMKTADGEAYLRQLIPAL